MVEKGERLPRLQRLQPQAHPAELGRHRVHVHAVQAAADDVAERMLIEERRRLALAGRVRAHPGEMPGEAMGRAHQEVAGADRRVADLQIEDRPLGVGAELAAHRLPHHRVEGRVQQTLHQGVGRVVGPGRLAGVAGELGEGEVCAVTAHLRREREQALVDAAQLLGAEVPVVHRAQDLVLAGEGEVAQRFEEVVVGQLRIVQLGRGLRAPEEAPERGKRQAPARALAVGLARKRIGQQPELPPQIAVARTLDTPRKMPQPCRAVARLPQLSGDFDDFSR